MALTPDLSEKQLDIFRSKLCQRLSRDGVCQWKSKCQFSHTIDWPRRPPRKHRYSPELCQSLIVTTVVDGQITQTLTGKCSVGRSCPYAHSAEEVLYHPLIYKTCRCEDFNATAHLQRAARGTNSKKRCPRYYCPFAHGDLETRTTSLTPAQVKMCLSTVEACSLSDAGKNRPCLVVNPSNPQEGGSAVPLPPGALDDSACGRGPAAALPAGPPAITHPRSMQALPTLQQFHNHQMLLLQQLQKQQQVELQQQSSAAQELSMEQPTKPPAIRESTLEDQILKKKETSGHKQSGGEKAKQTASGEGEHTILSTAPSARPWSELWAIDSQLSPASTTGQQTNGVDQALPLSGRSRTNGNGLYGKAPGSGPVSQINGNKLQDDAPLSDLPEPMKVQLPQLLGPEDGSILDDKVSLNLGLKAWDEKGAFKDVDMMYNILPTELYAEL